MDTRYGNAAPRDFYGDGYQGKSINANDKSYLELDREQGAEYLSDH